MDKNLNEIKRAIDSDGIKRPDSLSEENMVALIKRRGIAPVKATSRTVYVKRIASIAAALVVVVCAVAFSVGYNQRKPTASENQGAVVKTDTVLPSGTDTTQKTTKEAAEGEKAKAVDPQVLKNAKLKTVSDYGELEKYFSKLVRNRRMKSYDFFNGFAEDARAVDSAPAAAPPDGVTTAVAASAEAVVGEKGLMDDSEVYGKTNTQVENVDEADVIKNDGRYIYLLTDGMTLSITDGVEMKLCSQIGFKDENEKVGNSVRDFFVLGDKLIVMVESCEYELPEDEEAKVAVVNDPYYHKYYGGKASTRVMVYDIADRSSPKLLKTNTQDGTLLNSRMVDSIVYCVSMYRVSVDGEKSQVVGDCVPKVNGARMSCDCIYIGTDDREFQTYILLTAYDTASINSEPVSLSVLGDGNDVYCNRNTLFVAAQEYEEESVSTRITAFSIDGLKLSLKASGKVNGSFLNQFSMDEFNGYFRIATTSYNYSTYQDESNVYVLDGSLSVVGKLENIAKNEQVKAVRFMGNTAYVVTFVNTDPLFVIDLSTPTAPKILGEVKLPGFSTYLHPVGEGLMVGVGYDGTDSEFKADSVKISLFDVSNPQAPREVSSYTVKNASTNVNYNPKAFLFYEEKGLLGIPLTIYRPMAEREVCSYMVLKVDSEGLELYNGFVHSEGYPNLFRGSYIGESFYTITGQLIKRFDLTSFETTGTLEMKSLYPDMNKAVLTTECW